MMALHKPKLVAIISNNKVKVVVFYVVYILFHFNIKLYIRV
jgi:hypothetical protein